MKSVIAKVTYVPTAAAVGEINVGSMVLVSEMIKPEGLVDAVDIDISEFADKVPGTLVRADLYVGDLKRVSATDIVETNKPIRSVYHVKDTSMNNATASTTQATSEAMLQAAASKAIAEETSVMGQLKAAMHRPRSTTIGAAVGTLAAAGLEYFSDSGSNVSAVTSLVTGGLITTAFHLSLGNPDEDGPVAQRFHEVVGLGPSIGVGLYTFAMSACAGRIAASYFPGTTGELVDEPVTF